MAHLFEQFKVKIATLIFVYNIKECFNILQSYLDAMLFKHLLKFVRVHCPRAIVIKLKENVLYIVLGL